HGLTWDHRHCDKKMLVAFSKILNSADEAIGHNCVDVNSKILTKDFRWIRAGDLKDGSEIIGFDEGIPPELPKRINGKWTKCQYGDKYRNIKVGSVSGFTTKIADCVKVKFENGDEVITTKDHYWLSMPLKDNFQSWRAAKNLTDKNRVCKYLTPWEDDKSYEAGWLSGFISGEGTLKQSKRNFQIDFCQRKTSTLDQAVEFCKKLGYSISEPKSKITGGLGKGDTCYSFFHGGKFKTMEILGKLRIKRLLEKINYNNLGVLKGKNVPKVKIVSVEDIGKKEVAVFQTSCKTFFCDGYPMHNCDRFDLKWLKTRCLYHRIPMYPSYTTLDTLKVARSQFSLNSNKLDYIAKFLGFGGKMETGGFDLWKAIVLDKCRKSLDKMVKYCKRDVILLEKVYEELRTYAPHKFNYAVAYGGERADCPNCESVRTHISKTKTTAQGVVKRQMQCNDCGTYFTISNKAYEERSK
ncbi:MAG: hypothetical protein EBR82_47670, partial [Caulobacteraceae bacterium]|nr:hypothetical protein [Caulobacteraceae bacterium]